MRASARKTAMESMAFPDGSRRLIAPAARFA
jgi:hypothetical protein